MDFLPKKRPFSVTLALWGVFLLGMWQVGRAIALFEQRHLLTSLGVEPSPTVRIVLAVVWGLLFWGLGGALWQKRPFAQRTLPITTLLYGAYHLIFSYLFAQPSTFQQNLLLNSLFFLSFTLFLFWALNRKTAQAYFKQGDITSD